MLKKDVPTATIVSSQSMLRTPVIVAHRARRMRYEQYNMKKAWRDLRKLCVVRVGTLTRLINMSQSSQPKLRIMYARTYTLNDTAIKQRAMKELATAIMAAA